jgi:hypothetical protein
VGERIADMACAHACDITQLPLREGRAGLGEYLLDAAKNGFCTQIGNANFTWFGTTFSKNRANFLDLLRAGHGDYVINAEALAYMR